MEDTDCTAGNGAPGDGKGVGSNGVPDNARVAASNDARAEGDGASGDDRVAASECAPGDGRDAATDGALNDVPALSWLEWGTTLSATVGRVPSNETRGGRGGGRVGERQLWVNGSACFRRVFSGVGVLGSHAGGGGGRAVFYHLARPRLVIPTLEELRFFLFYVWN